MNKDSSGLGMILGFFGATFLTSLDVPIEYPGDVDLSGGDLIPQECLFF